MTNKPKAVFLFFLLFLAVPSFAQQNDAGAWLSVGIEKKLGKRLSVALTEEVRLMENFTEASVIFTDLGLSYKPGRNFSLAGNYRFENDRLLNNSYQNGHKFYFDLGYRHRFGMVILALRERLQSAAAGSTPFGESTEYKKYARTKATLRLTSSSRFQPYMSTEWFVPVDEGEGFRFDRTRNEAGVDFKLNPSQEIGLGCMYQRNTDRSKGDLYVVKLQYTLEL